MVASSRRRSESPVPSSYRQTPSCEMSVGMLPQNTLEKIHALNKHFQNEEAMNKLVEEAFHRKNAQKQESVDVTSEPESHEDLVRSLIQQSYDFIEASISKRFEQLSSQQLLKDAQISKDGPSFSKKAEVHQELSECTQIECSLAGNEKEKKSLESHVVESYNIQNDPVQKEFTSTGNGEHESTVAVNSPLPVEQYPPPKVEANGFHNGEEQKLEEANETTNGHEKDVSIPTENEESFTIPDIDSAGFGYLTSTSNKDDLKQECAFEVAPIADDEDDDFLDISSVEINVCYFVTIITSFHFISYCLLSP